MGEHDELIARLKAAPWCVTTEENGIGHSDKDLPQDAAKAIEELTAENEALRSGAVCAAVKPLVWDPSVIGRPWHSAQAPWGVYYAQWDDEIGSWFASLELGEVDAPIILQPSDVETIDAAKAAAQADYARRLLPTLTLRSVAEVRAEAVAATWAVASEAAELVCVEYSTDHGSGMFYKHSYACGERIRALTPPADISAAIDAIKIAAWKAGAEAVTAWSPETNTTPWCLLSIEQMRAFEASTGQMMRLRQDGEWHLHNGQGVGVVSDTYRVLPIPERTK